STPVSPVTPGLTRRPFSSSVLIGTDHGRTRGADLLPARGARAGSHYYASAQATRPTAAGLRAPAAVHRGRAWHGPAAAPAAGWTLARGDSTPQETRARRTRLHPPRHAWRHDHHGLDPAGG